MIPDKREECPRCGIHGEQWHYDFQYCHRCGYDGLGLKNKSMKHPYNMVLEFHKVYLQEIAKTAVAVEIEFKNTDEPEDKLLRLRHRLIEEEFFEFDEGFKYRDEVEMLDALCDIIYVIYGMAISIGWDINGALEEVHRSNMSKLGKDGKPIIRDDGKILKGPNYFKPDLHKFIKH